MKLFHLFPKADLPEGDNPWYPWYDKAFGFVVRAENEKEARQMANDEGGDERGEISHHVYRTGGDPWLNPIYSDCIELTPEGEGGVVIRDIRFA